jgi:hypothetical protein
MSLPPGSVMFRTSSVIGLGGFDFHAAISPTCSDSYGVNFATAGLLDFTRERLIRVVMTGSWAGKN